MVRYPIKNPLHTGNSGTSAEFLTGLLALQEDSEFYVDGDETVYEHTMKALRMLHESIGAASFVHKSNCIPFTMKGIPLVQTVVMWKPLQAITALHYLWSLHF